MRKSNNDSGLTAKRSNRLLVAGLTAILMAVSTLGFSQDYSRLCERSIMGTARYVGMSGAMSAIGGDPAAAHDNVAGLGLYRRSEALISLDVTHAPTWQIDLGGNARKRTSVVMPQLSFVLSIPSFDDNSKVRYHNVLFSYRRMQSYNRNYLGSMYGDRSLGAQLPGVDTNWDINFCTDPYAAVHELNLTELGSVNEYAFAWAMNIVEQWYFGLGINLVSYSMTGDARYTELFNRVSPEGRVYSNVNVSHILYSGLNCSFSTGLIYRPTGWLRIGFGLETPSLGGMSVYTSGTLTAQTDSLGISTAPDLSDHDSRFYMPLHTSTSVAFQIGAYGMIALQHDFLYQKEADPRHSLRVGLEVIPVLGLYLNAGYAYESSFRNNVTSVPMDPTFDRQDTYTMRPQQAQYASFGVGYRGKHVIVQAAYQYRWQNVNLFAHEYAQPYRLHTDSHRVVLTIGWHRY